jgi:hypothetical protein
VRGEGPLVELARPSARSGDPGETAPSAIYLGGQRVYYDHVRFDVAAADRHALHILESAF